MDALAAVECLGVYLKVKGLFIAAAENPDVKSAKFGEFYETILSYLEKQTNLPLIPFWNELEKSPGRKLETCRYFNLLGDPHGSVRSDYAADDASIFVIMSGKTTVTTSYSDGTTLEELFTTGQTFGAIARFNDPFFKRKDFMENYKPLEMTVACFLSEGTTVLQLLLSDFRNNVIDGDIPMHLKDPLPSVNKSPDNTVRRLRSANRSGRESGQQELNQVNQISGQQNQNNQQNQQNKSTIPCSHLDKLTTALNQQIRPASCSPKRASVRPENAANRELQYFSAATHRFAPTRCGAGDAVIKTADVGTKLIFSSDILPSHMYLVLDGTVRLQLERVKLPTPTHSTSNSTNVSTKTTITPNTTPNRSTARAPAHSPVRDLLDSPVNLQQLLDQSKKLPICDFEAGSLLYLADECFTVEAPVVPISSIGTGESAIRGNNISAVTSGFSGVSGFQPRVQGLYTAPPTPRPLDSPMRMDNSDKRSKKNRNLVVDLAKEALIDPTGLREKWMNGVLPDTNYDNSGENSPIQSRNSFSRPSTSSGRRISLSGPSSPIRRLSMTPSSPVRRLSMTPSSPTRTLLLTRPSSAAYAKSSCSFLRAPSLRPDQLNNIHTESPGGAGEIFSSTLSILKPMKKKKRYDIIMSFEKPTTYITIPVYAFKIAMIELSLQQDVADINTQLNRVSNKVIEKVISLIPWIDGGAATLPLLSSPVRGGYTSFVHPSAVGAKASSHWVPEPIAAKNSRGGR